MDPRCTLVETHVGTRVHFAVRKGESDAQGQGQDNLAIWSLETGELVSSYINKSFDQW